MSSDGAQIDNFGLVLGWSFIVIGVDLAAMIILGLQFWGPPAIFVGLGALIPLGLYVLGGGR